eukprot:1774232-Pyramimonas_sp.AAC.1
MRINVRSQSGRRLPFVTNLFIKVAFRTGSCGKCHPAMSATDGQSYRSCSTTDQLKDIRTVITCTWRPRATSSRINTGRAGFSCAGPYGHG